MTKAREAASYQDTLTGHNKVQEHENQYVTIQQAAKLCGVSSKTIQRSIQSGTLPARYPTKNRCEIAVSDLERIRPGHMSGQDPEPLAQRLAALEQRVQQLEHLVTESLGRPVVSQRQNGAKARGRTTGPLPKRFVSLLAFARLHNIAEATVRTHMDIGLLPVERGVWTDIDGIEVVLALNAKGRTAFYHLYHSFPRFLSCPSCSHGYQDTVSGQS